MINFIIIISCDKKREFEYPLIFTGDVTDINNNGAIFNAKIVNPDNIDIVESGFVWDSKSNPTIANAEKFVIGGRSLPGVISEQISTTLQVGVTYYVRAFVRCRSSVTYGKEVVFTSLGSLAPEITDFIPKTGDLKDTLIITGHHFSYRPSNNVVLIDKLLSRVIKANQDTLWIVVPENLNVLDAPVDFSGSFYVVVNNKAYFGINGNKGFREYNPINDEFKILANFPGPSRDGGSGFAIGNKIFYGTGYGNYHNMKDIWEYDISSDSWIQKSDFPGKARKGSMTFSING